MKMKLFLIGHVGSVQELRTFDNGRSVLNFTMATGRRTTNPTTNEQIDRTTWWRVAYWGRGAEAIAPYLAVGKQVEVEANQMTIDEETGGPKVFVRNDGTHGASFECVAQHVLLLGKPGDTPSTGGVVAEGAPSGDSDLDLDF